MFIRFSLGIIIISIISIFSIAIDAPPAEKEIKLFMIGNSFSQNAMKFLPDIAVAGGKKFKVKIAYIGGGTMEQHCQSLNAYEKDPNDKLARRYDNKSLPEMLQAEKWDLVSIQQGSSRNWDKTSYMPFAGQLALTVKKYVPDAELILHVTWSRHDTGLINTTSPAKKFANNQLLIQDASESIAKDLGNIRMVQSGLAIKKAYEDIASDFKIENPPNSKSPFNTLHADGLHVNNAGCYLVACVWYEFLWNESIVGNNFIPKGFTKEQVTKLQNIAHDITKATVKDIK
jgi:hypothetical protein